MGSRLEIKGNDHYLGEFFYVDAAIKARHRAEELDYAPLLEKYDL